MKVQHHHAELSQQREETELQQWQQEQQQQEQQQPSSPCSQIATTGCVDLSVTTLEAMTAFSDCRKRKRNTYSAIEFSSNLAGNIRLLRDDLNSETYEIGPTRCFVVTHPRPREVWAGDFRDRVVHHILYNRVGAKFVNSFVADSSACIPGRGTLYGSNRLEKHIRSASRNWTKRVFFLKLDLSNFFVSIHKPSLFRILEKGIHDPWTLRLAEQILFHDPVNNVSLSGDASLLKLVPSHKSLFNAPEGYGLPIGNLSSQFFANVYLNELDRYVKHKVRPLAYTRYVDDFVLIHPDPKWLNAAKLRIEGFLWERLLMKINPTKTILQPVGHGVDFVGRVVKPWHTIPRGKLAAAARGRLGSGVATAESLTCTLGALRQSKSFRTRRALCELASAHGFTHDDEFTKFISTNT